MNVAAIVVTYNSAQVIEKCLHAILEQTEKFHRIVVFDNNSTDKTLEIIKTLYQELEIIESEENTGFAGANNRAVEIVNDCEFVALINPDAFLYHDWLEKMLAGQSQYPEYGSFASLQLMEDKKTIDGAGDVYHHSGLAWRRYHGRDISKVDLNEEDVFSACAAAALYNRRCFVELGGFDESYFCYFEDVDLGLRLNLSGRKCRFIPDAKAVHVGSTASGKESAFSVFHGFRNLEWTFFKSLPWELILLFFPSHLLLFVISIIFHGFKGKLWTIVTAKYAAISGLFSIWGKRKRVHSIRKLSIKELLGIFSYSIPVSVFKD